MHLLIAENDKALAHLQRRAFLSEGHTVSIAGTGDEALTMFLAEGPDLLLLDLEIQGRSGEELLGILRELAPLSPIVALTAKRDTRVLALNSGADDCVEKPFSLVELRARVRALLRRQEALRAAWHGTGLAGGGEPVRMLGPLRMDRLKRVVELHGAPVAVTNREFGLLEQLLLARGATVSRAILLDAVWGGRAVETNVVDVYVTALRRKLGRGLPELAIETVRGAGYCLRWLPAGMPLPAAAAGVPAQAIAAGSR